MPTQYERDRSFDQHYDNSFQQPTVLTNSVIPSIDMTHPSPGEQLEKKGKEIYSTIFHTSEEQISF
jgi:hypothetical protein